MDDVQNESVEDTFLDLAVYSVIAYAIYHHRYEKPVQKSKPEPDFRRLSD